MRKIYSVLFMFLFIGVNAQQNEDFEGWTTLSVPAGFGNKDYDSLHSWQNSDDLVRTLAEQVGQSALLSLIDNTIAQDAGNPSNAGSSSVRMTTVDCAVCAQGGAGFDKIPGFVNYSDRNLLPELPEAMNFSYKYTNGGGDRGVVMAMITGNGAARDTLAIAMLEIEAGQASWGDTSVRFNYLTTGVADSITILAMSSGDFFFSEVDPTWPASVTGSELNLDDISFTYPTPGVASPVGIVLVEDISNNADGTDLQVSWGQGLDESTIQEYRVFAVKEANASGFDLTTAEAVQSPDYYASTILGLGAYEGTFTATSTDVDGDLIVENEPYVVFIMSVADGTNAQTNSLSYPSDVITLTSPAAAMPIDVVASDLNVQQNGSDLNVEWNNGPDEFATVSEYRLLCVKSSNASSFDLAAAEAVSVGSFYTATVIGGPYLQNFDNVTTDVDGDPITLGVPYKVFVLAIADGTNAVVNSLSLESNEVILGTASVNDIQAINVSIFPNPSTSMVNVRVDEEATIKLVSMNGEVLTNTNGTQVSIDVSDFASGVYFVQVENSKGISTQKVVVK